MESAAQEKQDQAAEPQQGNQPGVDVPAEGNRRKRGPSPDAGQYLVFAAEPVSGIEVNDDAEALEIGELTELNFKLIWGPGKADSQREAKQMALDAEPELKAKTEPGGPGLWLLAPPLASGKPKLAKADQPPPVLRGL